MKKIALILLAVLIVTTTGYFGFKRFLRDREALRSYTSPWQNRPTSQTHNETKTVDYTPEELAEAKKTGKLPKSSSSNSPTSAQAANEAAVQRTLQTLQEINKINEMNQRLQEQQQRMNRKQ